MVDDTKKSQSENHRITIRALDADEPERDLSTRPNEEEFNPDGNQVYCLEPIDGTEQSHHWNASTLEPISIWVLASDENDARNKAKAATHRATNSSPGNEVSENPYTRSEITRCIAHPKIDLPAGVIVDAHGYTHSLRSETD